jgi:hypothetical protein
VQNCISTKDNFSKNQIKVFPNPAKDRISVTASAMIKEVEIVNLLGQKLLTKNVQANETSLEVEGLLEGEYFLKVFLSEREFEVFKVKIFR